MTAEFRNREIGAECFAAALPTLCAVATAGGDHSKAMEICLRMQRLFDQQYRVQFVPKSHRDGRIGGSHGRPR